MSHTLSRIVLEQGAVPNRWTRDWSPYRLHQDLWRLFAEVDGEPRPFLFRHGAREGGIVVYTVSAREPRPDHPFWRVERSRPYDAVYPVGAVLGFSLRGNPTRDVPRGKGVRSHRADVVMHAKALARQRGAACRSGGSEAALVQDAASEWLQARADSIGVRIDARTLRCDGYRQHAIHRRGQSIRFSTVDFEGILVVQDPQRFRNALLSGVGRSRAFGCGLMLARRP